MEKGELQSNQQKILRCLKTTRYRYIGELGVNEEKKILCANKQDQAKRPLWSLWLINWLLVAPFYFGGLMTISGEKKIRHTLVALELTAKKMMS
jgi:hypothetical protein